MSRAESKTSNITADGQVLYLDAESLEDKVDRNRPLRKNKSDGLGVKNWLVHRMSLIRLHCHNEPLHMSQSPALQGLSAGFWLHLYRNCRPACA